ncbi:FIG00387915: hypothetical protein [hydrothermal vent metagenome]|uniref:Uncharacterized protein n=1 Tax=hydrothermal vent metagenome TaxID=652676 RepID=A0A1W1D4A1_9ZZZZ
MRLVNVLALTNGLLVNDPFVSNFTNIVFDTKSVKRGDLFIAFDKSLIPDAIKNGAYGIIFDKPTKISDDEIAWIKVDDVSQALKKLLRFRLVELEVVSYSCDEIVLQFALQMMIDPKLIIVHGDIQKIAKTIWNIEPKTNILFSPLLCDSDIFTDIKSLPKQTQPILHIIEKTLFETSFIYQDKIYERQMISPLFIPYLEQLITLLHTLNINFRLRKFTQLEHFKPLFINKSFQIQEFGTTDKVIIFENSVQYIPQEIEFLQHNANWANLLFVVPHYVKEEQKLLYKNLYSYKSKKGLIKILKQHPFHFALVLHSDSTILELSLPKPTQLTLEL